VCIARATVAQFHTLDIPVPGQLQQSNAEYMDVINETLAGT
jgi:hypothetical protein